MKVKNKDIMLVPITIVGGKILSFVFNALLASYYGAGKISDAFIMAHSIPTILFEGVATAFISCYIPIQRMIEHKSPEQMEKYNSNMTSISILISLLITLVYFVFQHRINGVYAKGFDDTSLALLDKYTSILVWSIPMIGAYSIFRGYLQVSGKKTVSSLYQVIAYSVLIVALVLFFPRDAMLAWATLFGNLLCFFIFGYFALKSGYRYKLYISLKEDYIRSILLMIGPIILSTLASELASIIDKYFASQYSDGIITSMTYGYQLSFAMQGIASASLVIIIFPTLSDRAAQEKYSEMNDVVYIGTEILAWIIIPLVVGGVIIARPLIRVLFGHGSFTDDSVLITSDVFKVYLIGVFPMCMVHIGDRVCIALKKTRLAMITTLVTVGSNIILDCILGGLWGYVGLVFATGISIVLGMITNMLLIWKQGIGFSLRRIALIISRPMLNSIIMGITVFFLNNSIIHFLKYINLQKIIVSKSKISS